MTIAPNRLSTTASPEVAGEVSIADEARAFRQVRWLQARTIVHQALQTGRLRLFVLCILSAIFWVGLFALFNEGFRLLESAIDHPGTRAQTVQIIYNLFFISLLVMLFVSSAIIMYGLLYRSDETKFLLTTPTRTGRIVLHKFQESVVFSCWGFLLLASPMLIAYGIVAHAPLYYYLLLLPMIVSFVIIPASLGAIACIAAIRWFPHDFLRWCAGLGLIALGGFLIYLWWNAAGVQHDIMTPAWFQQMLAKLRVAEQHLLPSWWLSSGLLESAHPTPSSTNPYPWRDSVMFLVLLMSTAMMTALLVVKTGDAWFRPGYAKLQCLTTAKRRAQSSWLDRFLLGVFRPLPTSMRLLLLKDLRVFRRDPLQWSQFMIFFGLLCLYFFNIRRFRYDVNLVNSMNIIGLLNVGLVGLILSTFTTRFIFPMISLEGRRFWILGSLPIERDTILWSKLIFAFVGTIVPCATLVILSDVMLNIAHSTPMIAVVHQVACWALCLGLSAIAVGLGAHLPSMRESSPSKIAAGFGGTLNLVLSGIFIVSVVVVAAVLSSILLQPQAEGNSPGYALLGTTLTLGSSLMIWSVVSLALLISIAAAIVPFRKGLHTFRNLEF